MKNQSVKYAFNNKWTKELMEQSEIALPVQPDGSPDFDFMESLFNHCPIQGSANKPGVFPAGYLCYQIEWKLFVVREMLFSMLSY